MLLQLPYKYKLTYNIDVFTININGRYNIITWEWCMYYKVNGALFGLIYKQKINLCIGLNYI